MALAILGYRFKSKWKFILAGFCLGFVLLSSSSYAFNNFLASSDGYVSWSKMLLTGNHLPVFKVGQIASPSKTKIEDWLALISEIDSTLIRESGVYMDLIHDNQQGYKDKKWSLVLFERRISNYFASEGTVRFIHGLDPSLVKNPNSQGEYIVSYQNENIHREGIKFTYSTELLWGIQNDLALEYWDVTEYSSTTFDGIAFMTDKGEQLQGQMSHRSSGFDVFRQQPYYGNGFALSTDFKKVFRSGTAVYLRNITLFWHEFLHNVGLQIGLVETNREYYDDDNYLNHGPLIKGRYGYRELKLPTCTSYVWGINQQINDNLELTIEVTNDLTPSFIGRFTVKDNTVTYGLLNGSLHYIELMQKGISLAIYLGGRQLLTNPSSFGINIAGRLLF